MLDSIRLRARPVLILGALAASCNGSGFGTPDQLPPVEAGVPTADVPSPTQDAAPDSAFPDVGMGPPVLLAVEPDHGPFNGGAQVTLRGSNLNQNLAVHFGTALVQPASEMLTDSHRLVVATPPGEPGVVDVSIDDGVNTSTVPMAYTYDAFYAMPNSGSTAGGTVIELHGQNTNWTASTTVTIDTLPCIAVTFVGPSDITCTAPMHTSGSVPITVATGTESLVVGDGFTYFDGASASNGGFGGGHIAGALNVTVLASFVGTPIPNAFVYIGTDPTVAPPMAGLTNAMGEVTLSGASITGPVTITASAHCFGSTTFIDIDGMDATIYLVPWLAQVPGVDCGPPQPPVIDQRPGEQLTQISGELVWAGPLEFGPNPWSNIPEPGPNEQRVAYVKTTQPDFLTGTIDPGMGGTVHEVIPPNYGGRGYAYSIEAVPATLAVYAIAGIARTDGTQPAFLPYVMGVARGVLATPGASLTVDVNMDIELDHETQVMLANPPGQDDNGLPDLFTVEGWIDLGGEGVIPRPDVTMTGNSVSMPYYLASQPAFEQTIADARMIVRATYGTGTTEGPQSAVVVAGILTPDDTVEIDRWVGVPVLTNPLEGGQIAANRQVMFTSTGDSPNFFSTMISQQGSNCRDGVFFGDVVWWQHYFTGDDRTFGVPDISAIPGLTDIPQGLYQLSLCGVDVAGFDYNNFSYNYLDEHYWTAYAYNMLTISR